MKNVPGPAAQEGADLRQELAELMASVNEVLRFEWENGGVGLPQASPEPSAKQVSTPKTSPEATPAIEAPSAASGSKVTRLEVVQASAASCTGCGLHTGRTKSVFSRGDAGASVVFVGEGPGYHEDQSGLPFVGQAGQLLDKMIAAMGLREHEVYICNVVKCRPPDNRTPTPDEAGACMQFLREQIEIVSPSVIVALGRHAAENLGAVPERGPWRGEWKEWEGVALMSTYHPAYLLRTPEQKRVVWKDLQAVVAKLGRTLPERRRR